MWKCKFCNNQYEKERSRRSHQTRCKSNPNRVDPVIDYSKKKNNNQFTKARELGLPVPVSSTKGVTRPGIPHTEETKRKLSEIARKNGYGGVKQSRWIKYKGKTLGSSYELAVAEDLEKHNILWDTCSRFPYIDLFDKAHTYTPDLYLPEYDVYLDPKNDYLIENINPNLGYKDTDKIKWVMEQNHIQVIVLNKTQLSWAAIQLLL